MTDVDEEDMAWVLWFWEVGFCDAPAESGGSGVVDDAEGVEPCDGGCILYGAPLYICVPAGDGDNDV